MLVRGHPSCVPRLRARIAIIKSLLSFWGPDQTQGRPAQGGSARARALPRFCRIRLFILPGHSNAETGFCQHPMRFWTQTLKSTNRLHRWEMDKSWWFEITRANPAMISDYSRTPAYWDAKDAKGFAPCWSTRWVQKVSETIFCNLQNIQKIDDIDPQNDVKNAQNNVEKNAKLPQIQKDVEWVPWVSVNYSGGTAKSSSKKCILGAVWNEKNTAIQLWGQK